MRGFICQQQYVNLTTGCGMTRILPHGLLYFADVQSSSAFSNRKHRGAALICRGFVMLHRDTYTGFQFYWRWKGHEG